MATRYWVGGSGNWDQFSTTNWSATSGGAAGASAPTSADDVIFNSASSATSYVVTCYASQSVCRSITTTAPLAGTLTFTISFGSNYFQVNSGNINIHAACLFDSYANIVHIADPAGATQTVTFNGAGANTAKIAYVYNGQNANDVLNFCLSQTCSFDSVDIYMNGGAANTFSCTGATLTMCGVGVGVAKFNLTSYGPAIGTANLTTTTINIGGVLSGSFYANYGNLTLCDTGVTTFNASTLTANLKEVEVDTTVTIGSSTTTIPSAIGTINSSNKGTKYIYCDKLNVLTHQSIIYGPFPNLRAYSCVLYRRTSNPGTVAGTVTLTNSGSLFVSSTFTFSGAVSLATGNNLVVDNTSSPVFNGATTFTAPAIIFIDLGATATFNTALSVAQVAGYNSGAGTLISTVSTTLTGVGVTNQMSTLQTAALSMADANLKVTTLTVNGGVGKAFSVGAVTDSRYISADTATISTPTCSIVATAPRRIRWNQPVSAITGTRYTLSISGSTPTLTNVTFLNTAINNGASNYFGTRLGTDGVSTGFFPEPVATKYLVATSGSYDFYAGNIWALTSGGATSANNAPLPQDTIVVDGATNGQTITLTLGDVIPLGSYSFTGSTVGSISLQNTSGPTYAAWLFGNLIVPSTVSASQYVYSGLYVVLSGLVERYLTMSGKFYPNGLVVDVGNTTPITIGDPTTTSAQIYVTGFSNSSFTLSSGNVTFVGSPRFGDVSSYIGTFSTASWAFGTAVTINGTFTLYTNELSFGVGTVITTSNYTVVMTSPGSYNPGNYVNNAPTTATNGGITANGYDLTIAANSTTATNPLTFLGFNFGGGSGSQVVRLGGDTYVQSLYSSNSGSAVTTTLTASTGTNPTIYKTNGGRVTFQKYTASTTVNNVKASPANTFYTNGTLAGTTTGWNSGFPPAGATSGFLMF